MTDHISQARAIITLAEKARDALKDKNLNGTLGVYGPAASAFYAAANPETLISILTAFVSQRDEVPEAAAGIVANEIRKQKKLRKSNPISIAYNDAAIVALHKVLTAIRALSKPTTEESKLFRDRLNARIDTLTGEASKP